MLRVINRVRRARIHIYLCDYRYIYIYIWEHIFPSVFEKWPCARHISFTQTATSYTTDHNSFLNGFFYMKNDRVFYTGNGGGIRFSPYRPSANKCVSHSLSLARVFFIIPPALVARQCFIYTRFSTHKRFYPFDYRRRRIWRTTTARLLSRRERVFGLASNRIILS